MGTLTHTYTQSETDEQAFLEDLDRRMLLVQEAHNNLSALPSSLDGVPQIQHAAKCLRDAMGGAAWNPRSEKGIAVQREIDSRD